MALNDSLSNALSHITNCEKARKNVNVIEPFTNQREVGLNYVNELVESVIKEGAKQ